MSSFDSGNAYEPYVGRWSRGVAREFVRWLGAPTNLCWLDVGCGTAALVAAILAEARPLAITGIDRSAAFIAHAQSRINDVRVELREGDALSLPFDAGAFDVTVSGLVLNFLSDPDRGLAEMARATRPGGVVAVYVWDYAGGMELMRHFWDAALAIDPGAAVWDEGQRQAPLCRPDALKRRLGMAGLTEIESRPIDVPTVFRDFDDYWSPFLGGQGSAPGYLATLDEKHRAALRERLRASLPTDGDGVIRLTARAWAARGVMSRRAERVRADGGATSRRLPPRIIQRATATARWRL